MNNFAYFVQIEDCYPQARQLSTELCTKLCTTYTVVVIN